jgi:hypothetical protein
MTRFNYPLSAADRREAPDEPASEADYQDLWQAAYALEDPSKSPPVCVCQWRWSRRWRPPPSSEAEAHARMAPFQ